MFAKKIAVGLGLSICLVGPALAQEGWNFTEEQVNEAALTGSVNICWNQSVPAGYVIVGHTVTTACNGTNYPGSPNTKVVKEPAPSGEIVCGFPLPAGYVITMDKLTSSACASLPGGHNVMSVKLAGSREFICSNSPIPSGYQYDTNSSPSGVCRIGFAFNIWR
ncbi:hypothetical protein ACFOLC_07395 [Lysobacter cavernae]|uniref:Secreted protein n=1 Tax=Lysobacter cavernae TaxID=1685901 RepID=A0ABV7RSM7_9GAMM